jgi:chitinase
MSKLVDELHVMTYDFHDGNWGETTSGLHTNPLKSSKWKFSCEESIQYYLDNGAEPSKVFIGGAFYSRGFSNSLQLGGPASGGSPDMSWEPGSVDYNKLPLNGSIETNDPESKGAFSYDSTRKVLNTYDNKISLKEKCNLIRKYNIGGMIIWELSGDVRDINSDRNLVKFLYDQSTIPQQPYIPPPKTPEQPTNPTPTRSGRMHVTLTLDEKLNLVSSNVVNL